MNYYFITGTSRGIGKAIAEKLLERDDSYIFGISRSNSIQHDRFKHLQLDLSMPTVVQLFEFDKFNDADKVVLINNAGTLGDVKHIGQADNEQIERALYLNLIAPAILINKFVKAYGEMDADKLIINVTSGAAQNAIDGWNVYCSSKAGLDMFTRVVAKEQSLDNGGVRILGVAPGIVDTQMQTEIRDTQEQDFSGVERFIDYKESGMLASPEDVAEKYVHIIEHPEQYHEVIMRVEA